MVLLAVLNFTGNQHDSALRALRLEGWLGGRGSGGLLSSCGPSRLGAGSGRPCSATATRTGTRRALAARTVGARCGRGQLALAADYVALVDPHLDTDAPEGGLGFVQAIVDVSAQGVQRDAAFAVELRAAHLRTAEAARALHPDSLDVRLTHRRLDRLTHRPAERYPVAQLLGHALGHQLCLGLRVFHFEDVELDLLAGQLFQVGADPVGLGAAAPDDDARTRGMDVDPNPVTRAFDLHVGDTGALQPAGQQPPNRDVFLDVLGVLLVGIPARLPVGGDAEPEAVRIDFLAHYCEPPFASEVSEEVCEVSLDFVADAFFADAFFAGALAAVAFFSGAFLAGAFLAGAFLAGAFLAGASLVAAALLAWARRDRDD